MATCFSCGQNSPAGQVFCGTCGSPLDLSAFISAQVKTQLDASTKERDLVETETAIRVFEKALGWAKLVGYFCGLLIAGLVAGASFWGYDLKRTATNVAQLGETTTANINRLASDTSAHIQKQAQDLQARVSNAQGQLRGATELAPRISSLQSQLSQAQNQIGMQQKQIGVEEKQLVSQQKVLSDQEQKLSQSEEFESQLVRQTIANHRELVFNLQNVPSDKYYIGEEPGSNPQANRSVYFLLPSSPVRNSLQITFEQTPASPVSVFVLHNLVAVVSPKSRGELLSQFISVSYFVDTADSKLYRTISTATAPCCMFRLYFDGHLEIDGLLVDGTPTGQLYPNSEAIIGGIAPHEDH